MAKILQAPKYYFEHRDNKINGEQGSFVGNVTRTIRRGAKNLGSGASGQAFYQLKDAFKKIPKRFGL